MKKIPNYIKIGLTQWRALVNTELDNYKRLKLLYNAGFRGNDLKRSIKKERERERNV